MIISASRRSDIPARFAEWFMARVREGHCDVTNPFNARQVTRVSLMPADVDAVVFWSKNPAPLLPHLDELEQRGFRCGFLVTVNEYPREIEPGVPPLADRVETVRMLSGRLGVRNVVWRYDPIILSDRMTAEWHMERYCGLARLLAPYVDHVIVSFVDFYRKTERRLRAVEKAMGDRMLRDAFNAPDVEGLIRELIRCSGDAGLSIQSCAEDTSLEAMGIPAGACIDSHWIQRFAGIEVPQIKDPGQRGLCRCVPSRDVGQVNTCTIGCRYCYATDGRHDKSRQPTSAKDVHEVRGFDSCES
jgi:hypothetical protein